MLRNLLIGATGLVILLGWAFIFNHHSSPIPASIKNNLNYPTIYPSNSQSIVSNSYNYNSAQKNLVFDVYQGGNKIVMSEQRAPGDSSDVALSYYQNLGLHPLDQIQTKLGLAIVANFFTSGYGQAGQNAVLVSGGTLLIASPDHDLSPEAWKTFLNGLDVSK